MPDAGKMRDIAGLLARLFVGGLFVYAGVLKAAGLAHEAEETVRVDERLRHVLTAASYEQVKGTPLILAMRFDKP